MPWSSHFSMDSRMRLTFFGSLLPPLHAYVGIQAPNFSLAIAEILLEGVRGKYRAPILLEAPAWRSRASGRRQRARAVHDHAVMLGAAVLHEVERGVLVGARQVEVAA